MAEAAFRKVQIGPESSYGDEVDATLIFPCDPGSGEFTLNRATEVPDEDYGRPIRNQSGRGSHGVRIATGSISAPLRFQDFGHLLQMGLGTATTTGSGTYTHVWKSLVSSSTSVKSYTFESTDGVQPFIATGVVATSIEIGFDALAAGGNQMWTASAELQANDLSQGTATAGLSDPSTLETAEGHLSIIKVGPVGTAFASLTELSASLVSYQHSMTSEKPGRPYGGTADKFAAIGQLDAEGEVTFQLKVTEGNVDATFDIFNVAGALPTERRVRVTIDGSGDNVIHIDHRLLFTDVHIEADGRDGERLISVTAQRVYDSTLASDVAVTLVTSDVASF